jgi:hypothetical protein
MEIQARNMRVPMVVLPHPIHLLLWQGVEEIVKDRDNKDRVKDRDKVRDNVLAKDNRDKVKDRVRDDEDKVKDNAEENEWEMMNNKV